MIRRMMHAGVKPPHVAVVRRARTLLLLVVVTALALTLLKVLDDCEEESEKHQRGGMETVHVEMVVGERREGMRDKALPLPVRTMTMMGFPSSEVVVLLLRLLHFQTRMEGKVAPHKMDHCTPYLVGKRNLVDKEGTHKESRGKLAGKRREDAGVSLQLQC